MMEKQSEHDLLCQEFGLAWAQFKALFKKNLIITWRRKWQVLTELMIPVIATGILWLISLNVKSENIPGDIPQLSFDIPEFGHLLNQTAFPNLMCLDDNIFYQCNECSSSVNENVWGGSVESLLSGGLGNPNWRGFPGERAAALWSAAHYGSLVLPFCAGAASTALPAAVAAPASLPGGPASACNVLQAGGAVCGFDQGELQSYAAMLAAYYNISCSLDFTPSADNFYSSVEVLAAATAALAGADDNEDVLTVPAADAGARCSRRRFALAPASSAATELQAATAALGAWLVARHPRLAGHLEYFADEAALEAEMTSPAYEAAAKLGAAVVLRGAGPGWDYSIRLNDTKLSALGGWEWALPMTSAGQTNPFLRRWSDGGEEGVPANALYYASGFLSVQREVEAFVLEQETGSADAGGLLPGGGGGGGALRLANFPYAPYTTSAFWEAFGSLFAIFMVLSTVYPVSNALRALVQEKELKLREGMQMMGLSPAAHAASWVAHYVLFFAVLAALVAGTGKGLFRHSDYSLIWAYFLCFFLAAFAFVYWLAAFFSRAKTAAVFGMLLVFLTLVPYMAFGGAASPRHVKFGLCLLPASCFALGTDAFAAYEDAEIGVTRETYRTQGIGGSLTFEEVLGMCLLDFFLYGALAWYTAQVWPSEWGTHRKPWFLFTRGYWAPRAAGGAAAAARARARREGEGGEGAGGPNQQPVPETLRAQLANDECVALRGLNKVFRTATGPKRAVDDLNLTMYCGQVTALLGHNGAGKTTTVAVLTGLLPPSGGVAVVQGRAVGPETRAVRRRLGVCPQHDVLYPALTVREHLALFAACKGVPRAAAAAEVEKLIVEVGLTEKRDFLAKNLSGGQKRKLSVAIAFIGNSKVVFLDEPTSGMDPYSRRFTWGAIRRRREGRVIVLTTHFMDEADLLGDRIAIMAHGRLQCAGSSLFLKARYGVGYNLTLVKKTPSAAPASAPLPEAAPPPPPRPPGAGRADPECPGKEALPQQQQQEEVKLESVQADEEAAAPGGGGGGGGHETKQEPAAAAADTAKIHALLASHVPEARLLSAAGAELTFQLPAAAARAFPALLGALDAGLAGLGLATYGLGATTLEEVFLKVAHGAAQEEAAAATEGGGGAGGAMKGKAVAPAPSFKAEDDDAWKAHRITGWRLVAYHFWALLYKRALNYRRDRKALLFTLLGPAFFLFMGILVLNTDADWAQPSLELSLGPLNAGVARDPHPVYFATNCTVHLGAAAAGAACAAAAELVAAIPGATAVEAGVSLEGNETIAHALNEVLLESVDDWAASRYGAYSFSSQDGEDVTVHTNFTGLHAAPAFVGALYEAALQLAGSEATVTRRSHSFPLTATVEAISESVDAFNLVIFVLMAFAFIPAGFAQYIVRERESKTKHQQVVSGVSLPAFWLSSLAWDFLTYLAGPLALTLALLHGYDVDQLIDRPAGPLVVYLLLLFGLAAVPATYLTTFAFDSASSAQTVNILLHFLGGLIAMMVVFIMSFFDATVGAARVLRYLLRPLPQYCLADGLLRACWGDFLRYIDPKIPDDATLWHPQQAGLDLVFLGVEAVLYPVLVLVLERALAGGNRLAQRWERAKLAARGYQPALTPEAELDADVAAEARRVAAGGADGEGVALRALRKAYPLRGSGRGGPRYKEAVRGVSLGVPRGQCFGLLGINGAGKTTTLSILSGEQPATGGRAEVNGLDVATHAEAAHRLIGYCPQFDAVFANLTARENLKFYGMIKGIPPSRLEGLVAKGIHQLQLTEYADRLSGGYSGGNKRKLSVAVAMIGGPELIFLDEPSTGMDPVARRFMWEVITRISTERQQAAIILTTHSMEECEALCTRIGIMVGGQLRCLGSAQHLKSRFGLGYQLELGARTATAEELATATEKLQAEGGQLSEGQLGAALQRLGYGEDYDWRTEFLPSGSAATLGHELAVKGAVSAEELAAWALLDGRVRALHAWVGRAFEGAVLRERQAGRARFEVPHRAGGRGGMAGMFAALEGQREALGIEEYALSQTSLEQIFNFFASQQEEEKGKAEGMIDSKNDKKKVVPAAAENMV